MTNKGLAARVRTEGQRIGLTLSTDHVSVKRWLDGGRPQGDTARCIAAALGAKLGRVITFAEIGLDSVGDAAPIDLTSEGALYPSEPSRSIDVIDGLTDADIRDDSVAAKLPWDSTATPGVITGYLFAEPSWTESSRDISFAAAGIAGRIRATVRNLTQLDFQYGGGHTRKLLLSYWKTEIVPALRGGLGNTAKRDVFAAAADAAEVLGWSAYDAGRHGAAQRYFVQGLRLAREAGDAVMGGQILSNLSHQANYLGNFTEAMHYARAAQSATVGQASATVNAMFLAMEARALASLGDAKGCGAALNRAEQEFGRRRESDDPDWISYFDALELAGEAAHCFRDLGHSRHTQLWAARAIDPVLTPARTRSFICIVHADGALADGNLDEALALAGQSVELAGSLQSSRHLRYVSDFYSSLMLKYDNHAGVREFTALLRSKNPELAESVNRS
ncbi:hypothetical protein [Paractinoplanes rishiriensis]|uniref:hypothetical protein n=1 Tax=Paractinoplanes rishiriensis TaxID=1050105 RepID=UPI001942D510|nr:hypothetical protein [Actinoplanes rishiriensis]